jgi:hypothetical protein
MGNTQGIYKQWTEAHCLVWWREAFQSYKYSKSSTQLQHEVHWLVFEGMWFKARGCSELVTQWQHGIVCVQLCSVIPWLFQALFWVLIALKNAVKRKSDNGIENPKKRRILTFNMEVGIIKECEEGETLSHISSAFGLNHWLLEQLFRTKDM